MERQPVVSSNLVSVGYDESKEVLEVEFGGGGVYQYQAVPKQIFEEFMAAPSMGRYFYSNIRDRFQTEKVLRNYG